MADRCPRCNLDLSDPRISVGDVLVWAETGELYRVTEPFQRKDGGYYGTAERCWPPYRLHEHGYQLAVWPDHVRQRRWVPVTTPLEKLPPHKSEEPKP